MFDGLLLGHLETKLSQHLFMDIAMLDMRDVGIDHEGDQVQDKVCTLAEDSERRKAEILESRIVHGLHATHGIEHLFANLDRRSKGLRISPENVAKVD